MSSRAPQASGLLATALVVLAVVSIGLDDPSPMALPFGVLTAGLAFYNHTRRSRSCGRSVRVLKDKMSRAILEEFERAKLEIASATFEVVGVPPMRIEAARESRASLS